MNEKTWGSLLVIYIGTFTELYKGHVWKKNQTLRSHANICVRTQILYFFGENICVGTQIFAFERRFGIFFHSCSLESSVHIIRQGKNIILGGTVYRPRLFMRQC